MTKGSWIALAIAGVIVAFVGHTFVQIYRDRPKRGQAQDLLNAAEPYKAEVAKAWQARSPMPAAASLPRHARAMSARPDGTVVIEVSDELFPGGRLMLQPSSNAKGDVMWTCSAEKVHGGLLPAWCRPGFGPIDAPRTPPPPQAPSPPAAPR